MFIQDALYAKKLLDHLIPDKDFPAFIFREKFEEYLMFERPVIPDRNITSVAIATNR